MFEFLSNLFRRSTTSFSPVASVDASQTPVKSTSTEPDGLVFLDTETTGLNTDGLDEVLEIAIVDTHGRTLLDTLVRPVRKSEWPQAQAIHGIRPEDVANAPTWKELLPEIAALCAGKTMVSYNAPFDSSFFPNGFFAAVACAMSRYTEVNPDRFGWVDIADAAASSGYATTYKYHRALTDARACRHIWLVGIPALERAYPPIRNAHVIAKLELETGESIPVVFKDIFPDELRFVKAGSQCKLWTKEDREEINVYRPRTLGGSGKIATLDKAKNQKLTECLLAESAVKMWLRERTDDTVMFAIAVPQSIQKKRRGVAPTANSVS